MQDIGDLQDEAFKKLKNNGARKRVSSPEWDQKTA